MFAPMDAFEAKFWHDQDMMHQALPSLPQEDEYYAQFGSITNEIAGGYEDLVAFTMAGKSLVPRYLIDLYRLNGGIPAEMIDELESRVTD